MQENKIIQKLSEIDRKVDVLGVDVSVLKTDVSVLKTDISTLKTDMVEVKTDVVSLKSSVSSLELQMTDFSVTQDRIIDKLVEMDGRMDEFVTKDDLNRSFGKILDILDGHTVILNRLDQERVVANERIDRNERDIRMLKLRTAQP